jgi:hypothetical protein
MHPRSGRRVEIRKKTRSNLAMRNTFFAAIAVAAALSLASALPASAKEGGCVKGGAVGAVAGHFLGSGHAVAGAAAGCAVGVHRRHQAERSQAQDQQQQGGQQNPNPAH